MDVVRHDTEDADDLEIQVFETDYCWLVLCSDIPLAFGMGDDQQEAIDSFIESANEIGALEYMH